MKPTPWPVRAVLRLYRWVLVPLRHAVLGPGPACRFRPSCSEYASQAFQHHGPWRASRLVARRLCRCHPWGGFGLDPVPAVWREPRASRHPKSVNASGPC